MPRKFALPIAALVWAGSAAFMWATLLGVNLPMICGRVLAPWAYAAEQIVFLPTIWLTRPLDQWLESQNFGMAITVGSAIETAFLATIYSGIIYLLLRRRFIEALERFIRRFGWAALAIVAAMIGSSVWLRTQLHAADYGAPLTHDSPTVNLNIRIPIESDQKITASAIRSLPLPELENASIIARDGAPPLLISVKTNYIREPSFHTRDEYVLYRVFADHLQALPNVPIPGNDSTPIGEPRCPYGPASEVLVALPGAHGSHFRSMSLISPSLSPGEIDLGSPQIIASKDGNYYAGFDSNDLQLLRDGELLTTLPNFSDHNLNNAALTRTSDGILHILATAVLIPHENSSRVHYLRFDPRSKRVLGNDVLMVRAKFTSTSTPRIARSGDAVDAYWHTDGGSTTLPEDGVYAHRIGEHDAWHLISERAEFVVLEDADGGGGTLVGAATHPSESGIVRWFYRKAGKWFDLGQTDAGEKLYTMVNTGTEPFAVWRGETPGTVHAAFYALSHIVVEDLQLPQI
ncbi:MAG: hypothetical protein DMF58_16990 [Acidobacteria bacterium]|nr:MAG: hypothetical protein DMF58_16990 [Acidobacteriota bacterium]